MRCYQRSHASPIWFNLGGRSSARQHRRLPSSFLPDRSQGPHIGQHFHAVQVRHGAAQERIIFQTSSTLVEQLGRKKTSRNVSAITRPTSQSFSTLPKALMTPTSGNASENMKISRTRRANVGILAHPCAPRQTLLHCRYPPPKTMIFFFPFSPGFQACASDNKRHASRSRPRRECFENLNSCSGPRSEGKRRETRTGGYFLLFCRSSRLRFDSPSLSPAIFLPRAIVPTRIIARTGFA